MANELRTMYGAIPNSPVAYLTSNISAADTEMQISNAGLLPDAPNLATLGLEEDAETILYTTKTGNSLKGIQRGFQGAAKAWQAGTPLARVITAYDHNTFKDNIQDIVTGGIKVNAARDADNAGALGGTSANDVLTTLNGKVNKAGDIMTGNFIIKKDYGQWAVENMAGQKTQYYEDTAGNAIISNNKADGNLAAYISLQQDGKIVFTGQEAWHYGNLSIEGGGWTPILKTDIHPNISTDIVIQNASYYKISRLCFIQAVFSGSITVQSGGAIRIGGLPFGAIPYSTMAAGHNFIGSNVNTFGWVANYGDIMAIPRDRTDVFYPNVPVGTLYSITVSGCYIIA